jgi:uncharacterized protein (DUF2236 family)
MPADWAAFRAYFDRMCREELELTPAARGLLDFARNPPASFPLVPTYLYRLLRRPTAKPMWWLGVATLPEPIRDKIGERWTDRDERLFRAFRGVVRRTTPLVPRRLRYTGRARAGFRRTGAGPR